jgi:hypothetical protein
VVAPLDRHLLDWNRGISLGGDLDLDRLFSLPRNRNQVVLVLQAHQGALAVG